MSAGVAGGPGALAARGAGPPARPRRRASIGRRRGCAAPSPRSRRPPLRRSEPQREVGEPERLPRPPGEHLLLRAEGVRARELRTRRPASRTPIASASSSRDRAASPMAPACEPRRVERLAHRRGSPTSRWISSDSSYRAAPRRRDPAAAPPHPRRAREASARTRRPRSPSCAARSYSVNAPAASSRRAGRRPSSSQRTAGPHAKPTTSSSLAASASSTAVEKWRASSSARSSARSPLSRAIHAPAEQWRRARRPGDPQVRDLTDQRVGEPELGLPLERRTRARARRVRGGRGPRGRRGPSRSSTSPRSASAPGQKEVPTTDASSTTDRSSRGIASRRAEITACTVSGIAGRRPTCPARARPPSSRTPARTAGSRRSARAASSASPPASPPATGGR